MINDKYANAKNSIIEEKNTQITKLNGRIAELVRRVKRGATRGDQYAIVPTPVIQSGCQPLVSMDAVSLLSPLTEQPQSDLFQHVTY